jgi:hypothetical protein
MADPAWFLLYGGSSPDGASNGTHGVYVGRTTDPAVAREHLRQCRADLYSTGHVRVATDTQFLRADDVESLNRMTKDVFRG